MNTENKATTGTTGIKTTHKVVLAVLVAAVATLGVYTLYTNNQYKADMEYMSTVKVDAQNSLLETIPNPEVSLPDQINYPHYMDTFHADYREEIEWLHQLGLNGLVEPNSKYFYPYQEITEVEWRGMLATAFPNQAELYSSYDHSTTLYTNDWWKELDSHNTITQAKMIETSFKAIGLEVYQGKQDMNLDEQYSHLGWVTGLVRAAEPDEEMHRYEAAHVIYNLIYNREGLKEKVESYGTPELLEKMNISYGEVTDNLGEFMVQLDKVPETIINEFIEDDWNLRINDQYQYDYNSKNNILSGGVTTKNLKTILVLSPSSITHEFGHYLDNKIKASSTEEFKEVYQRERAEAAKLVSDLNLYNAEEYFCEMFSTYLEYKNQGWEEVMQETIPMTFEYMQTLETNNWGI